MNLRQIHLPLLLIAALPLVACEQLEDDTAALCRNFSSALTVDSMSGASNFELRVTNNSDAAQRLTVPDGCSQVRFETNNSAGTEVWASDDNVACTQALTYVTYSPGQTISYAVSWNQKQRDGSPAPAGQYTVVAIDRTECGADLSKSASFTLQ